MSPPVQPWRVPRAARRRCRAAAACATAGRTTACRPGRCPAAGTCRCRRQMTVPGQAQPSVRDRVHGCGGSTLALVRPAGRAGRRPSTRHGAPAAATGPAIPCTLRQPAGQSPHASAAGRARQSHRVGARWRAVVPRGQRSDRSPHARCGNPSGGHPAPARPAGPGSDRIRRPDTRRGAPTGSDEIGHRQHVCGDPPGSRPALARPAGQGPDRRAVADPAGSDRNRPPPARRGEPAGWPSRAGATGAGRREPGVRSTSGSASASSWVSAKASWTRTWTGSARWSGCCRRRWTGAARPAPPRR